jgi:hypothetical protein
MGRKVSFEKSIGSVERDFVAKDFSASSSWLRGLKEETPQTHVSHHAWNRFAALATYIAHRFSRTFAMIAGGPLVPLTVGAIESLIPNKPSLRLTSSRNCWKASSNLR